MPRKQNGFEAHCRTHDKLCGFCHKHYDGNANSKYCSKACKQAAYRSRKITPLERAINKKRQYQKMVETKAATIYQTTCCGCGCTMTVTALQGLGKLYHNRACKQRAYRERKAAREQLRDNQS